MIKSQRSGNIVVKFILHTVLIINVFMVLYPIAFTVGAAFTKTNSLSTTRAVPWPKEPSLYQFKRLLTPSDRIVKGTTDVRGTNYVRWYKNTLKIAIQRAIFFRASVLPEKNRLWRRWLFCKCFRRLSE